MKWKHFPCYWPFVLGIQWSPVCSHHKGQWRGALIFSFICAWINGWINNREAGDLRLHRAHFDVIVMDTRGWGFKTTCEILNLRARKFTHINKLHIFQCMEMRYSASNFKGNLWNNSTQNILPIHRKRRLLFSIENVRAFRYTSS